MFGLVISDVALTWVPPSCVRIEPHASMLAATGITVPFPAGGVAVEEVAQPATPVASVAATRGTTRDRRDMQAPVEIRTRDLRPGTRRPGAVDSANME
ncbi:hypothetical protein GCM10009608_57250 [Pseudonocardia alaniniphila]